MKKRVLILGSTGSIGRSTLDVLDRLRDEFTVVGLAAGSRARELADQANRFRPEAIAIANGASTEELRGGLDYAPRVFTGRDSLLQLVELGEFDIAVCGVVGVGGLPAVMRAIELGRRVALANKEALVVAGSLIMPLSRTTGATIVPVDSEHSAIFQAMHAGAPSEVARLYLTASGGPFRTWDADEMQAATPEDAMNHPTWDMGPKITIDSATMMNKALEIVEAKWLFDLDPERIEVLVHPESIIHSMVEFCDGSVIAQLGTPDMRTPIQYALTYPARRACPSPRLNLADIGQLRFEKPDRDRFPALALGYQAARRGGTCGAVLNAANEAAVGLFRDRAIGFADVARYTQKVLNEHQYKQTPSLADLLSADQWAREEVTRCMACS
jgi:1-deoxy-D-xylulose-5-phosphate reductoisomerase